jgi:glutamate--cysteine ligase
MVIGCEYEVLIIDRQSRRTVPYAGSVGIAAIMSHLADHFDWSPIEEDGNVIALTRNGQSITLEPGGQFELSGSPKQTLADAHAELQQHIAEIRSIEAHFPVTIEWRGLNPYQSVDEIQWVPKERYQIMRRYLPTRGALATTMMGLTCTVQTNLDYTSEEHFSHALRTATGISALVTALFANSPWKHGDSRRYQSYRSLVWTQVDPDRCGIQPFVFETDCGYADYVDWVIDVPMFFVQGSDGYVDLGGSASFRDLMEGRVPDHDATPEAWDLHLSTVFPEVRAKTHLEFRSADVVPPDVIPACPALWKGLIYSTDSLDPAWDLVKKWSLDDRRTFATAVAYDGLQTRLPVGAGVASDLCRELVDIATSGLIEQAARGRGDSQDAHFLEPLYEILSSGQTLADQTENPA